MVDVVTATLEGQNVTGRVVKDLEDGRKRVEVMRPPALAGRVFVATPEQIVLVRPVGLKVQNYPEALDYLPPETNRGLVYLKNTLILVVLNVIGTILSSSIVAYAFARMRFPGKNVLFLVLLSTMMLPAAVTLIPQFLIFRSLGWIDTLRPLWVTAFLGSAFNIFLLRQFFMTIPLELEDAAKIDGCSYLRTFWQVMLPQIKPALAVVAIWTFLAAWNNFLGPLIYVNSPENMPISYAVQLFQSDRTNEPGLLMAFATMAMIPVLLVFFFAQKYFIEGVTLSGLGGR
jgi:multiple sugar transport system permease protein